MDGSFYTFGSNWLYKWVVNFLLFLIYIYIYSVLSRLVLEKHRFNVNWRLVWKVVRIHYRHTMYGLSLARHEHLETL